MKNREETEILTHADGTVSSNYKKKTTNTYKDGKLTEQNVVEYRTQPDGSVVEELLKAKVGLDLSWSRTTQKSKKKYQKLREYFRSSCNFVPNKLRNYYANTLRSFLSTPGTHPDELLQGAA